MTARNKASREQTWQHVTARVLDKVTPPTSLPWAGFGANTRRGRRFASGPAGRGRVRARGWRCGHPGSAGPSGRLGRSGKAGSAVVPRRCSASYWSSSRSRRRAQYGQQLGGEVPGVVDAVVRPLGVREQSTGNSQLLSEAAVTVGYRYPALVTDAVASWPETPLAPRSRPRSANTRSWQRDRSGDCDFIGVLLGLGQASNLARKLLRGAGGQVGRAQGGGCHHCRGDRRALAQPGVSGCRVAVRAVDEEEGPPDPISTVVELRNVAIFPVGAAPADSPAP